MVKNQHLLTDIQLNLTHRELRPVYSINTTRQRAPGGKSWLIDAPIITGRDNLVQAIIMRLLTPQGELSELGHPLYGSRLHEFIGRVNTETTRNLLKLRILESLQAEARIDQVVTLNVAPSVGRRSSVDVTLQVLPVGETDIVTIGPITLEL